MRNAVSGFSKTGIFPTDRYVFEESDFVGAETTEIDRPINKNDLPSGVASSTTSEEAQMVPASSLSTPSLMDVMSSTSTVPPLECTTTTKPTNTPTAGLLVSPADVMPISKISREQKRKTDHRRGKTAVITSSPYKNELLDISEDKKRRLTSKVDGTKRRKQGLRKVKENDENICIYCQEEYGSSRADEGWVQCLRNGLTKAVQVGILRNSILTGAIGANAFWGNTG